MLYCPPNISIHDVWVDEGTSQCFLDTVTQSVFGGFIMMFGLIQWGMYHKYATVIDQVTITSSCLFVLQVILTLLMPGLAIVRFALETTIIGNIFF